MLKVRNKTFETNSSSTHSITICDGNKLEYNLPIKVKPAWHGEFGWEWEKWNSIEEKLAYMIRCLICYDYNEQNLQEKIKPIQEKLNNLGIQFDLPTYSEWQDGYVDHEDWYQDEIQEIYDDEDMLLKFLLSKDSYIEGGNDNE